MPHAHRWLVLALLIALVACDQPIETIDVPETIRDLHQHAIVADLHSDFAIFHGDPRHTDAALAELRQMRSAGVALVGASILGGGIVGNFGMRAAFWWYGWPSGERESSFARATAQLALIDRLVAADPAVRIVRTSRDLSAVQDRHVMGLVLVMEGGEPLIDDLARVRAFYDRGVRAIMLTHARDNPFGGSGSPSIPGTNLYLRPDRGLTDAGRKVLAETARVGMILDLAHASPATFRDALAAWSGPVMVSHAAIAAIYPSRRNLSDEQLRAIADRGGVVGIFVQTQFLGGTHLRSVADHILHAVQIAGATHVGLGLDMQEVTAGVLPAELQRASDLPKLTALLYERGLPPETIAGVLGMNFLRFFAAALPAGAATQQ